MSILNHYDILNDLKLQIYLCRLCLGMFEDMFEDQFNKDMQIQPTLFKHFYAQLIFTILIYDAVMSLLCNHNLFWVALILLGKPQFFWKYLISNLMLAVKNPKKISFQYL